MLGKCQAEELTINKFVSKVKDRRGLSILILENHVRTSKVNQEKGENELEELLSKRNRKCTGLRNEIL